MKRTIMLVCSILLVLFVSGLSYATEKESAMEDVYSDVVETAPQADTGEEMEDAVTEYSSEAENQETMDFIPENDQMGEETVEESE